DDLDRDRQRTGLEEQGQLGGLALVEVAGDDRLPAGDADVARDVEGDAGAGDDLVVEQDGDAPLGRAGRLTRRIGGQARPLVRAIAPEVELDRPAAADRVEEGECVAQVLAGELGRTDADSPARLRADDRAFLGRFLGGGGGGRHGVKGGLGRLADEVDRPVGGGDVGQLDDDPAVAGGLDVGLDGAHRVDATSQHFDLPLDEGGGDGDRVGVPGFV